MKGWLLLIFCLGACSAGNDVTDGTRGQCATGGALDACAEADRTAQGACWRLVDCGAIALHVDNNNGAFDWDKCVDDLEALSATGEQLAIDCIATSSCDALRVDDSPANSDNPDNVRNFQFACYLLGTGGN